MQYVPAQDAAKAEALELIAAIIRECEKLLHIAKKSQSEMNDIEESSHSLIDKVYELELLLAVESREIDPLDDGDDL